MFLAVHCTITGRFRVCHNKRITRNKMFRDYAKRGKSTWLSLLEHRTDGSDAFDTLYIGCEKSPQADISPVAVDTGGIM